MLRAQRAARGDRAAALCHRRNTCALRVRRAPAGWLGTTPHARARARARTHTHTPPPPPPLTPLAPRVVIALPSHQDIAAAVRGLGMFPSKTKVLSEVIPSMIEHDEEALTAPAPLGAAPDGSGGETRVSKEAFVRTCTQALREQQYRPDDSDTLLLAFRTLDAEGNGWLDFGRVKELFSLGDESSFSAKEVTQFATSKIVITATSTGSDGVERFFYEDYIRQLAAEVEKGVAGE